MQKNKLHLHIYGIHLLNPYKTVVSHLKCTVLFCHYILSLLFVQVDDIDVIEVECIVANLIFVVSYYCF